MQTATKKKTKGNEFPHIVRQGSSLVKIYKSLSRGHSYFKLAYYLGGQRKTQNFTSFEEAKNEADIQVAKLSRGDIDGALFTGKDRLVYGRAVEAVRPCGVPLDTAAIDYAEAKKLLGDVTVAEAARFYVKYHSQKIVAKRVSVVVDEMIAEKRGNGLSQVYLSDLRYRCGSFGQAFQCDINAISPDEIRDFLSNLNLSARSYNNFLGSIRTMFEYAKTRRYIAKDSDVFDSIPKRKDKGGEIEIFSPDEFAKLLAHSTEDMLPCLAIAGFAGLRSEEIRRLDWSEIHLAEKFIEITADKAKTASRRLAPITDNLAKWLSICPHRTGKVWTHGRAYFFETLEADANAAKVKWKHNALRHSFISYRLADIQDMSKVALEAGNSAQMIFKHYRELVRPSDAQKWFSIAPVAKGNVVPMLKAAKAA